MTANHSAINAEEMRRTSVNARNLAAIADQIESASSGKIDRRVAFAALLQVQEIYGGKIAWIKTGDNCVYQAAPDLLNALKSITNGIESGDLRLETEMDEVLERTMSIASKAIAKAEGK